MNKQTAALAEARHDAERRQLTVEERLHRIRLDVDRLAITTWAPSRVAVKGATSEPLLTQLRAAIRTDQGSTGRGRSDASSSRIPLDADALHLYEDIQSQIGGIYLAATDLHPTSRTPEQQLLEWWWEFSTSDPNDAQLINYGGKIASWRLRIERHFTRPRELDAPGCPHCGYTHLITRTPDGHDVQQRTLVGTWDEEHPERGVSAQCRYCGQRWSSQPRSEDELPTRPDLEDGIRDLLVTLNGATRIAPPMDPDCRDGKHRACPGSTWDDHTDTFVDCGCPCHRTTDHTDGSDR